MFLSAVSKSNGTMANATATALVFCAKAAVAAFVAPSRYGTTARLTWIRPSHWNESLLSGDTLFNCTLAMDTIAAYIHSNSFGT
jgi:hypothetical protein